MEIAKLYWPNHTHAPTTPETGWRWPHFRPSELACKGSGSLKIDPASLDKLEELRATIGKPLRILSAYRSPAHNRKVGGATNSQHLAAKAFDVMQKDLDPAQFVAAAILAGFTGFGFYPDQGFIHIDTGPARSWGNWPGLDLDKIKAEVACPAPARSLSIAPRLGPVARAFAALRFAFA